MLSVPAEKLLNKPGRPRRQLFVVTTLFTGDAEGLETWRQDHLHFLEQLNVQGILVGAGPTLDSEGCAYRGDGMIIVRAGSAMDAGQLVENDPYHVHCVRTYKITPWLLSEGVIFDHLIGRQPE